MKRCGRCRAAKPLDQFPRSSRNKDGRGSRCSACAVEATREWREAHPDITAYRRREGLLARYGMTPEQYDELAEQQGHRCALCDREVKLVVDHDHVTGRIRGLLCIACNGALGKLGDSTEALQRVLRYLEGVRA